MDDKRVLLYKAILRVQEKLYRLSKIHLERFNLSDAEYGIINNLGDNALTLSELSQRMLRVNSNTTAMIDRLEARGLARREPDPDDRRVIRVRLTEAGKKLRDEVVPKQNRFLQELLAALTDFEASALIALLEKVEKKCLDDHYYNSKR
ncbi:MAG: MarR family transcriptional regulator [Firmicutes bacterium]|nr:MarR family transcriptional regulator [Bacillota bacterium]